MTSFSEVRPEHVLAAMREHDRLGRDAFLEAHGFGPAQEYTLLQDGRTYDSKAVLGAAHLIATGTVVTPADFSGGKDGAARVLRGLGFEVEGPEREGWTTVAAVGGEHARASWALAARERLLEAAKVYHSVVTYKELADFVQRRTRIRTGQLLHYWIGDVLGRVAKDCLQQGEPILSALCVDAEGHVGKGYAGAVTEYRLEDVGDPDDHAARERLACHEHFGAELPPAGGVPAWTPQVRARRQALKKAQSEQREPAPMCPVHFVALPVVGGCDLCE